MTQVVLLGGPATTFCATCDECGTAFAGRLDEDLAEGVFLCRFGHQIRIERRDEPPLEAAAVA